MSESDGPSPSHARSDEERAAFFEELMREERRRRSVSGLAVATLVVGVLGGLLAPVLAVFALARIRERAERGTTLVFIGLAAFAVWVAITIFLATTDRLWWQRAQPEYVSGFDLTVGECFDAPPMSGEISVVRLSCSEGHTGEVFADFDVPDGPYPGTVELYEASLTRCESLAAQNAAVDALRHGRVQVMTPTSDTWEQRKPHRIVCYFRFTNQVSKPI